MTGENRRAIARGGFRLNLGAGAMVYRVMWRCTECEYHNDDWDEVCAKCNTVKPDMGDATAVLDTSERSLTESEQTADPHRDSRRLASPTPTPQVNKKRKRNDPVVLLTTLLIVFMLATLGLLGYIAWQRGLIKLPITVRQAQNEEGDSLEIHVELAPVVEDPLLVLADSRERAAKSYKAIANELIDTRGLLAGMAAPPPGQNDELTTEQHDLLDQLNSMGKGLLYLSKDYEEKVRKDNSEDVSSYQETLSDEFSSQFTRITELIGQVYGSNTSSTHEAYLLPDLIKSTVAVGRLISLSGIDDAWVKAKEDRVQRKLDAQYPDEIRQLVARVEALKEVHQDFKAQLDALPPYKVRVGNLNKGGEDALVLLDNLMTTIETLAEEHKQYTDSLVEIEMSDRMDLLAEEFDKLAKEDHYFCFSEICRISVDDKELNQPAYENLRLHYKFIEQFWPEISQSYLDEFNSSERDWKAKWE